MKVVSILELQSNRALRMFRAEEGPDAYRSAVTAAGTTIQTALALFLERELHRDKQAEPSLVELAVLDGLERTQTEWLSATLRAHSVAGKYATGAQGKATYETALRAQSTRNWDKATFAAARTAQIAFHWLSVRRPPVQQDGERAAA